MYMRPSRERELSHVTSAATPITVSSDPMFYGMTALSELDVRSDTVQEVSSNVQENSSENAEQSDGDFAILEAENGALRLAADAAATRLRLLRSRTSLVVKDFLTLSGVSGVKGVTTYTRRLL